MPYEYRYQYFIKDKKFRKGDSEILGEVEQLTIDNKVYEFRNQSKVGSLVYQFQFIELQPNKRIIREDSLYVGMNAYYDLDKYKEDLMEKILEYHDGKSKL